MALDALALEVGCVCRACVLGYTSVCRGSGMSSRKLVFTLALVAFTAAHT